MVFENKPNYISIHNSIHNHRSCGIHGSRFT